jgi:hypothetical protein
MATSVIERQASYRDSRQFHKSRSLVCSSNLVDTFLWDAPQIDKKSDFIRAKPKNVL